MPSEISKWQNQLDIEQDNFNENIGYTNEINYDSDKRYSIGLGQFYITNVCNLTCDQCISFNNRMFKGHYDWKDYEKEYTAWSQILDIKSASIIGGEAFTHPRLEEWAVNLKKLWHDVEDFSVVTNGTFLKTKVELSRKLIDLGYWLEINHHQPENHSDVLDQLKNILSVYDYTSVEDRDFFVKGKRVAKLERDFIFLNNAQKLIRKNTTYFWDSDPDIAHDNCLGPNCHYFNKGRLHKCWFMAVAEDFVDQFKVEKRAVDLLKQYRGASPYDENLDEFFTNLLNTIPQCKLCPEEHSQYPITFMPKKLRL